MATLKSLVDETTNIKNELKECHTNLKNNLIEKGVECSDTDKMLSLIGKVKNTSLFSKISDNILFSWEDIRKIDVISSDYNALQLIHSIPCFFNGSCRVDFKFNGSSSVASYYSVIVKLIRDGEEIYISDKFNSNTAYLNVVLDINNIKPFDTIQLLGNVRTSNGYLRCKEFYIKGDVV